MSRQFQNETELQVMYDAVERRRRDSNGAAPATVEALMYELRTFGLAALTHPQCQQRLTDITHKQLNEVIERLSRLRSQYPAIRDELLSLLGELP